MSRKEVAERLKGLLVGGVGISEELLNSEQLALVGDDGIMDSVAVLRLIIELEKEFGIIIADDDIRPENFHNLSCLIDYVQRKLR